MGADRGLADGLDIVRAWLVTWEWASDRAPVEDKDRIAAVLNSRLSAERVKEIVEILYVNATYSLSERLGYASREWFNPYPAQFGMTPGEVTCGHNPWLYARIVDQLQVERDEAGEEKLTWQPPSRPRPPTAPPRR